MEDRMLKIEQENEPRERGGSIERFEGLPVRVNDNRDPRYMSFDLSRFLDMIARIRKEGLFKVSRDYGPTDFGKYVYMFASSESDHWGDSIERALAIEINLSTYKKSFGSESLTGATEVEVKVLMDKGEGRVFRFKFNNDGTYRNGGWDNVSLEKRLRESSENPLGDNFTLEQSKEPKEISS